MKKVLFLVFLLMMLVPVKGLENDQNIMRRYKYYRLNKVLGPFVQRSEVNDDFPLIDEESYTEGELSELSINKPLEQLDRKIYEYDGYHYLKTPQVNIIEIKMVSEGIISDIKIENLGKEIECESGNNILTGSSLVKYDLNGDFNLNNLVIKGNSADGKDTHSFKIYFKNGEKLVAEMSAMTFLKDIMLYGNSASIKLNAYEDIYSLDKLSTSFNLSYKGEVKLYQYQDYKYQSYKLEREYYDQYLNEPFEDYIYKDENDYIDIPIISNDNLENLIKEDSFQREVSTTKNPKIEVMDIKNLPLENISTDKSLSVKLPTHYQHVLKLDNKKKASKNISNVNNTNHLYDYFKILVLFILLILMLKLKNKVKEYSR